MNDVFRHLHMPVALAQDFIATFSRMEYALKAAGYANGDEKKVEAWWDKFANEIDASLCALAKNNDALAGAVEYLLSAPPRKQVLRHGALVFIDQKIDIQQAKAQQTLLMIRTVRNNLFHGGKFLAESEPGRDERLVTCSLTVLLRCLALHDGIQQHYES